MFDDSLAGPLWTLSSDAEIGLIGDLNGDTHAAMRISADMRLRGIACMIQVGNFGFLNSRLEWANLEWLNHGLAARGQKLFFVDGNHENFDELARFPIGSNGVRWITQCIGHLPRGFRGRIGDSRTLVALGGASSADAWRGFWDGEAITDEDIRLLGDQKADILIGHDAPLYVPSLDAFLEATQYRWPSSGRQYAASGREMFHRGFVKVRPRLTVGGHYQHFVDETVRYSIHEEKFESRVVLLDDTSSPESKHRAILNTDSLALKTF